MIHDPAVVQFRDLQVRFARYHARIFMRLNLSLPKYALLSQIALTGKMTLTEASQRLMISKPALTNLVKRLEKNGFVKKSSHPSDKRSHLVQISPKGLARVEKAQRAILDLVIHTLEQIPEPERIIVRNFYALLGHAIDEKLAAAQRESRL